MKKDFPSIEQRWGAWTLAGVLIVFGLVVAALSVQRITNTNLGYEALVAWQAALGVATAVVGGGVVGIVLAAVQHQSTTQIAQSQTKLAHDLQVDLVIQTTRDLSGFDLRGMDLTGMHLADRDFSRAQLADVKLVGVNLDRSVFDDADLTRADLSGASIRDCSFDHADLTSANLAGCDMTGTTFGEIEFDGTTVWPEGFTPG